jgi:hypothetical protein
MTHVLLGEWGLLDNLNDTSGNARHASANFSPTYINGPTTGTRGIQFSGAGQTINYGRTGLEPAAAAGGICTMGWVKVFSSHANYTGIMHKARASDSSKHSISVSANTVFWMDRWRDQLNFAETGSYLADFTWHHVCNVDADDRWARFVDGVKIAEASRTGSSPVSWENFPWFSGYSADMVNYLSATNVAVSGLRIFSGTLSDAEVLAYKNLAIVPAGRSGKPKVWSGSAWVAHPAKVWNGTAWVTHAMKGYDGSTWVTSK